MDLDKCFSNKSLHFYLSNTGKAFSFLFANHQGVFSQRKCKVKLKSSVTFDPLFSSTFSHLGV